MTESTHSHMSLHIVTSQFSSLCVLFKLFCFFHLLLCCTKSDLSAFCCAKMSFKELKRNTLKVSFLHCDGVIWCRDTGITNIWDLMTYLSNAKFVTVIEAVFTLAADFVFSHSVQFLRSLVFVRLCLDCQTCFWASVWAPRCLELLLPAFFLSDSFSPTLWASSVLSLQPSRSVSHSVSHWRSWGLWLQSGSSSLFLTWAFAAAPGSQDEICCVPSFPNWAQLNTEHSSDFETFCMFFFYFLEDTLRLPQPSVDHFHFLFCLSGVLCWESPPPVLSLWALQSSWALVMVVLQILELSASHSSHPQYYLLQTGFSEIYLWVCFLKQTKLYKREQSIGNGSWTKCLIQTIISRLNEIIGSSPTWSSSNTLELRHSEGFVCQL